LRTEGVDRGLNQHVGKAEYDTLQARRQAMRSIWPSWLRWNFRCLKSRWQGPSIFIRHSRTRIAETVWEMMVASATPATPMWNTMTKNRFKKTLMTPARVKK